jgi:mono/diheme cytochrome c family protein
MQSSIPSANRALTVLLATLSLAACGEGGGKPAANPAATVTAPARTADAGQLARGAEIYRQNCASCHGERAQGAFSWQKPGADGKYLPPPLNGTAHDWHHPTAALKQTIRNGTQHIGGNMPPWRDKLTEADIEAVIAYFQSLWPEEIYRAWQDLDRRARMGAAKQR